MKTLLELLQASLSADQRKELEKSLSSGIAEEDALGRAGVDPEAIASAKAELAGTLYVDLREKEIPQEVVRRIPKQVAEANHGVAYDEKGDELMIGLVDPNNFQAVQAFDFLAQSAGKNAHFATISQESFAAVLGQYEVLETEVARALEAAKEKFDEREMKAPSEKEGPLEEVVKGAPVSRMVATIMRYAVEQGASDIHIEPFGKETRVRYRVDGVLQTALPLPGYVHEAVVSRVKVLANMKLDETRVPQDGRITQTFDGRVVDFRVSTLPVVDHEKVVMRILDTSVGIPSLEDLGFNPGHVALIAEEIRRPHGLLLVSGPTGSGKSTTLYTGLTMLNEEGRNILTLEDPVEYYIKGVNQSQIRPEIGYSFASGLRSLLRQDPNVIMVGEIRDHETAELAVHAALTGHLIFSTIHTNDSFGVIPRLVDLGVEPFLLAATLNAAVAQRLARRLCQNCKVPDELPTDLRNRLKAELEAIPKQHLPKDVDPAGKLEFWKGKGCETCRSLGYVGRVAVAEILLMTPELQKIVTTGFAGAKVAEEAERQGMLSLRQDAILKALAGQTTVEEVLRITEENPMV